MNKLFQITAVFFALSIIITIIQQFAGNDKMFKYLKPAIYGAAIIVIISFVSELNFNNSGSFDFYKYNVNNDEIWNTVCDMSEGVIKEDILKTCLRYKLDISDIAVDLKTDMKDFVIKNITVYGPDKEAAKNIISVYYGIDDSYIKTED